MVVVALASDAPEPTVDEGRRSSGPPAAPPSDPMIGRLLLERYELLERIGTGGMGTVYRATQKPIGQQVAVKLLRSDLVTNDGIRERFRREAEIIGRLRHPNTIRLIDYGETADGSAAMVTELLIGQPLGNRLREGEPLPLRLAIQLAEDIAEALAEAHGLGLVHRDLKPGNIFLVDVGGQLHAKVLDFGIARILDEEATRLTADGQVFGTPRYMSPEQSEASGEVDGRTDIYSLGLIIFECLAGRPPFIEDTSVRYLTAHLTKPPPRLSEHVEGVPEALDELIAAALVKDRAQRIGQARDLAEGFRRIGAALDRAGPLEYTSPSIAPVSTVHDLLPDTGSAADEDVAPPPKAKTEWRGLMAGIVAVIVGALLVWAVISESGRKPIATPLPPEKRLVQDKVPVPGAGSESAPVVVSPAPKAPVGAPVAPAVAVTEAAQPKKKARPKKPPTRRRPKRKAESTLPGAGSIAGPRSVDIPIDAAADERLTKAGACQTASTPPGTRALTVKECPADCAVLVDGTCGGRTPIETLSLAGRNKVVSVICGKRVVFEQVVRLPADRAAVVTCD